MWNDPANLRQPETENVDEMAAAARLAKAHGFDYALFKAAMARDASGHEVLNASRPTGLPGCPATAGRVRRQLDEARELADGRFRIIESPNLAVALGETPGGPYSHPPRCHLQQLRQVVSPIGIFACAAYRGHAGSRLAPPDGYASPQTFASTSRATRRQVDRFRADLECVNIACLYSSANRFLEDHIANPAYAPLDAGGDLFL